MVEAGNANKAALAAHGQKLGKSDANFSAFYAQTLAATDAADLHEFTPDAYEAILRHSYERLGRRVAGQHLVHIWLPDVQTPSPVQIIDVFVDDMPFVVDSILAAIRALGGTIHLVAHPILPLDTSATPPTILDKPKEGSVPESFLQIHIDPITDEQQITTLFNELDATLSEVRAAVRGWRPMLERLRLLVQDYRQHPPQSARRRIGRNPAFPRMACRSQFHLPRHARISLGRRQK